MQKDEARRSSRTEHDAGGDETVAVAESAMARTMERQPDDLSRILADWSSVEAAAGSVAGRRLFVVGTGSSWHAANQGAYFLAWPVRRLAVPAADCALWGPRPTADDALVLLSHRDTKRYTTEVLARARAEGVPTLAIGGEGAPGIDIATVAQETSGTFTASHLGALASLAQLSVILGAELGDLGAVPAAVPPRWSARSGGRVARARTRVRGRRAQPMDRGRGGIEDARVRAPVTEGNFGRAAPTQARIPLDEAPCVPSTCWGYSYTRSMTARATGRCLCAAPSPTRRTARTATS